MTMMLVAPFFVFADDPAVSTPGANTGGDFVDNSGGGILSTSNPTDKLSQIATKSGYGESDLSSVVGLVIRTALSILGTIFIVMIVVAGIKWLSAGGDEKEVSTAKAYIKRAIIGLVITVSAWAIWAFISRVLAG